MQHTVNVRFVGPSGKCQLLNGHPVTGTQKFTNNFLSKAHIDSVKPVSKHSSLFHSLSSQISMACRLVCTMGFALGSTTDASYTT
jgi:hypothetical protein